MSNPLGFFEFLAHQPVFHCLDSCLVLVPLGLCDLQELIFDLGFRLINKLPFQTFLSVFALQPLLVGHAPFIHLLFLGECVGLNFAVGGHGITLFWLCVESVEENLTHVHLLLLVTVGFRREVCGASLERSSLLNEPVHVVVSRLICQFELVVQKLGVVDTEAAVLAAHADNFVNHIETVFRDLTSRVLV